MNAYVMLTVHWTIGALGKSGYWFEESGTVQKLACWICCACCALCYERFHQPTTVLLSGKCEQDSNDKGNLILYSVIFVLLYLILMGIHSITL